MLREPARAASGSAGDGVVAREFRAQRLQGDAAAALPNLEQALTIDRDIGDPRKVLADLAELAMANDAAVLEFIRRTPGVCGYVGVAPVDGVVMIAKY